MSTRNGGPIRELKCAPDMLTTGQIARRLSIAARTAGKLIDTGKLKGYRIPGSSDRRVHRAEFNHFCRREGLPRHFMFSGYGDVLPVVLAIGCEVIEPAGLEVIESRWTFKAGWEASARRPEIILAAIEIGRLELQGIAKTVEEIEGYKPMRMLVSREQPDPSYHDWYWFGQPIRGADLLALLATK